MKTTILILAIAAALTTNSAKSAELQQTIAIDTEQTTQFIIPDGVCFPKPKCGSDN